MLMMARNQKLDTRISSSPRGNGGVSCDGGGAFVGPIAFLHRLRRNGRDEWQPRDCDCLSEQMSAQYGLPIDISSKTGGLKVIAKALNEGDVARAQIATVLLGIPDPPALSKGASSRQQMIARVRDLHWSAMLKWDPAEHPRWPGDSDDRRGGEFAPKWITAAAEVEDERDPRFGIGGNHPPPEELIPQRLLQSPAGPVVQFLDNLLDLTEPADGVNLELAKAQMRDLLHAIHEVDPDYVYESIEPEGGLAGMSWQGRRNVINGLQADLAAAIYRVRGDIKPLQEVTLEFMQRATNAAYDEAVDRYNAGKLKIRLSSQEGIGNYVDARVRDDLRDFFNNL